MRDAPRKTTRNLRIVGVAAENWTDHLPNKSVQLYQCTTPWLALLLCMWKVPSSDLGTGTGYSDRCSFFRHPPLFPTVFRAVPQSGHKSIRMLPCSSLTSNPTFPRCGERRNARRKWIQCVHFWSRNFRRKCCHQLNSVRRYLWGIQTQNWIKICKCQTEEHGEITRGCLRSGPKRLKHRLPTPGRNILWRLLGNNIVAVNRALANHGLGTGQWLATAM
jgi:hypothetical protein